MGKFVWLCWVRRYSRWTNHSLAYDHAQLMGSHNLIDMSLPTTSDDLRCRLNVGRLAAENGRRTIACNVAGGRVGFEINA
jgi:hypothetical protein